MTTQRKFFYNGLIPCNRILAENSVKDFNELFQRIERNREMQAKGHTIQTAEKSSRNEKKRDSKAKKTLRSKKPFRILRTIFALERKRRSGFKGLPLCEMYFLGWQSRPKVLLSIALFTARSESDGTNAAENAKMKKRLKQDAVV